MHLWIADGRPAQASQQLALETALQAHANSVRVREADLRSQRGLISTALAALVALLGLAGALLLQRQRQAATPPPPPPADNTRNDDTRRSRGRRATDSAGLDTRPQPLLDRLRRGAQDTIPAEPLPPPR